MPQQILHTTLEEIPSLSKTIATTLKGGEIFALSGNLGSGKTTFVKAVCAELGSKKRVTSPTFTIMNNFTVRLRNSLKTSIHIYHLDLYRTKTFREIVALGITEVWGKSNTVTFIEWAEKIKKFLPEDTVIIKFSDR